MNGERWQRVRDVFEGALEQSPDHVLPWVKEQAGDDVELLQEVTSLLSHHERAASFLSRPADIPIDTLVDGENPQTLIAGQTVGAYTIVREAGRGGMGRVYVATDTRLNRTVALKVVSGLATDPIQRERLRREARAAASLVHPGICTVYALEEIDGQLFIASEFVEGRTLRDEINDNRRPAPETVTTTLRELTEALACAHEAGITHGDLKPENVIRGSDGRLKILDFGLARVATDSGAHAVVSSNDALTRDGIIVGTPGYMAPEQLKGRPRDTRSDVFGLGVSIYEFATGTHPFHATTSLAIIARVLSDTPQSLEELRPDLDVTVNQIVDRCLAKSIDARFASAADILRTLIAPSSYTAPRPVHPQAAAWWRIHQAAVVALYFVVCFMAWHIKEQAPGTATVVFVIVGTIATIAGVFRGHLLFTERINAAVLEAEQVRAARVTLSTDLALAVALIIDGSRFAPVSALIGLLTIALGVALALVRLVVEPATTLAAFGLRSPTRL